jgi:hypothetical protein
VQRATFGAGRSFYQCLGLKPQAESYYPFGISPTVPCRDDFRDEERRLSVPTLNARSSVKGRAQILINREAHQYQALLLGLLRNLDSQNRRGALHLVLVRKKVARTRALACEASGTLKEGNVHSWG